MSDNMSVFKKMKERITEEVNSATTNIQNMQIFDQLTSGIGQPVIRDEIATNQLLPEPYLQETILPNNSQVGTIDDASVSGFNEEDELNSELSPQHQLFNEHSIKRLNPKVNDSNQLNSSNAETSKSTVGSPQSTTKSGSKLRDLERLLAKCKESLKIKNSQINTLKESLAEVDKFKDYNQELRNELVELKRAHETWIVSVAENKRVMHQEIEEKNAEMVKQRAETNDLQNKLNNSNSKIRQLKSAIQDLESRLVSTSAAHQKERESLTKELNLSKSNAIKQIQKEHSHNLERVKLDLEKSIESLKAELLNKDEQLVRQVEQQQQLRESNEKMAKHIETLASDCQSKQKIIDELNDKFELESKRLKDLEVECSNLKGHNDEQQESSNREAELARQKLFEQIESYESQLKDTLAQLESANMAKAELEDRLSKLDIGDRECPNCIKFESDIETSAERFKQELHELHNKLNLMTTANYDQEKEINSLKADRNDISDSYNQLQADFKELSKKNESLARMNQENAADLQAHQDQLDKLTAVEREVEQLRKENLSLIDNLTLSRADLNDRNIEIAHYKDNMDKLNDVIKELKTEIETINRSCEEIKKDRDTLSITNKELIKSKRKQDEQLVVRILSVLKNLESPGVSPGSDKSLSATTGTLESGNSDSKEIPDPCALMEELSSISIDRCQSYVTASQRLEAVLLENAAINDELKRLRDEINNVNREKTLATQCSIDEAEELRTENEALINDRLAYEDRIKYLEGELATLTSKQLDQQGANQALTEELTAKILELEALHASKSSELSELGDRLNERDRLNDKHLASLEDSRSLLESYQQRIEELEDKLNELESRCEAKDRELALIKTQVQLDRSQPDTIETKSLEANGFDRVAIDNLEVENKSLTEKIKELKTELDARQQSEGSSDHTYQLKALQRILQQSQEENQRLKENQRNLAAKLERDPTAVNIPDSTEFEYLKNIVHQFMLGKEPLVLARVISAILKFDKTQVDNICKVQETVQAALRQGVRQV